MGKMKKRTISTLKAIFGSKKGKRHHSSKSSRSVTPDPPTPHTPSSVESFRPIPRTPPPPARVGPPPSPPVPTRPIAPVAPEPSGPVRLIPCAVCGRTFVPESLAKHVKICEKTAVKKRKTFDSSRQRREGTDLEQYLPKNFGLPENSPFLEKSPPNTAKAAPKPKPQSVRTTVMKPAADLQKCPHCNRAFGMRAFERHVEWCADKAKILPAAPAQPTHITDAKQRLNARTKYKAPLVRGRRSSQSRDKSSNSRSASVESARVSPPPPRDCGDGRRRARASESMSSNDCNDEPSPHVPVIRNPRTSQNNSSGDANVKARQARLARDLSSSRNAKEPNPPNIQQEIADPNPKKAQDKAKQPRNVKKEQQLKKLEEIANKYNERQAKAAEEKEEEKKKRKDKRQIPVLKRVANKNVKPKEEIAVEPAVNPEPSKVTQKPVRKPNATAKSTAKSTEITQQVKSKEKNTKTKTRRETVQLPKENSMSVDSLDDCVTINSAGNTKFCQTVGINTELFCVPCVIHENVDIKPHTSNNKNRISLVESAQVSARKTKMNTTDSTVELLYKNSTIDSSYNTQGTTSSTTTTIYKSDNCTPEISNDTCKKDNDEVDDSNNNISAKYISKSEPIDSFKVLEDDDNGKDMHDRAGDHFEDSFDHDASGNNSDETKYEEENSTDNNQSGRRHGSGDTYTKFTGNPGDLDEFMHLTDEIISSQNQMELDLEKHIDNLHTPKTVSLETLNDKNVENADNTDNKKPFSDTFEDLKLDLKQLLQKAGDTVKNSAKQTDRQSDTNDNKAVSDMEHITVYGLKHYERPPNTRISSDEEDSTLKLPSINVTNKPEPKIACTKKRMQKIFKSNRKNILLREQSRDNADNRTFIVAENVRDSDDQSISTEAPPLKLPRIESARLDDGYDPFVSAARQMKELLSSDTDIPKKMHNSSKDLTRTLPILRPARDKAPLSQLRTENSKLIKDTLNKTYQKTPTLQRMKSFGSTNNDNNTNTSTFGGRCSSFRLNRNDKKPSPKLNTTFTKSSKENISMTDKTNFNRNSSLNRSFSSYTTSNYSTPKPKDKIPKIATSMYHSFTRTIKQPVKLDKIKRNEEKKNFVNLDAILADDNSSMTDSNYIDPRLINENDNLPINVNTILNNPDIISSMESLLTTENLPSKFDSFSKTHIPNYELNGNIDSQIKADKDKVNNNTDTNKLVTAPVDNLSAQYDKIMSSLEESIASKTLARDEESVFEEFDLEEFMTTFDEEIHKRKSENKRTCSSTTRVVRQSELNGSNRTSAFSSVSSTPKQVNPSSNGLSLTPVTNKSFNFSSNNIVSENLFPSSVKRSTSLLDSIHKKVTKTENGTTRHKSEQLEQDIMQSLKEFDKFYESEKNHSNKDIMNYNAHVHNGTEKESRSKAQRRSGKSESNSNGNYTPNGKSSNDSAYSSLNRISPSKLTVCPKELNGPSSLERIPAGSDSSGSPKDEIRSISSEEFLAMERSAELDEPIPPPEHPPYKEVENQVHEKRVSSRASSRRGSWRPRAELSSSSSEVSLHKAPQRLSRFCHECGSRFPVDTAKFCIECGVKRLAV